MRILWSLVFLFIYQVAAAQVDIKIFTEPKDKGYVLYALNNEFAPVSVVLDLKLENLSSTEAANKIHVIPSKAQKVKLLELNLVDPKKRYGYSSQYKYTIGDITIEAYDSTFVYDLPYKTGSAYPVTQGYNGIFSHRGENALDFTMPVGTEVLASREGVVIEVVQNNNQACMTEDCQKFNNYVQILHPDGTIANYNHLKQNGARVKPGDRVKKGEVIALSGNTGWTSGPHLHFVCYLPRMEKKKTLVTLFRVADGQKPVYLKEKDLFTRKY